MAPSRSRSGATIQRLTGEGSQLPRKSAVCRRQNPGGDDLDNDGRRRFRFGNNNGDGDRDDNNNDGDGRGGKFFRDGNGNGSGNGDGSGNRDGSGDGNGNRNGDGDRDGNGNRFGNGFGNRFGGGNGNNNGDGNGSRFGNGFGNGFGNRFGDGFGRDRNDNNGEDTTRSIPSSSAETPSPSTSTPPAPPEPTSAGLTTSSAVSAPSTSTTEALSTFNPGVILLQSAVTGSPTIEPNPTVTAFIPPMTPGDVGGSANLSGSGGIGEMPDASSAAEPSVSPTPSPSAPPTGGPMDNENNGGNGAVDRLEVSRAGMDPTAERILISVGSIGGFILVCFIIWMAWRSVKKSKSDGNSHGRFSGLRGRARVRIPFFRRRSWQTFDDTPDTRSPPPSYREKMGSAHGPSVEGSFKPDTVKQQQLPPQSWPLSLPGVAVGPGQDPRQSNMYQPPADPRNTYNAANRPHITLVTNMPPYLHQPQQSFSSTNAAHFSSPMAEHSTPSPLQNGVSPVSYYNQPLLAQQFTAPYNPIYRQPSHAISEVSSLSSGFGDVDGIYITESIVAPPAATATPGSASNSPQQYTARFSWMSHPREPAAPDPPSRQNSGASRDGRRETVYTQSSEDRPVRFRSVRSWVNQQTGRIKRAQQRGPDQASRDVQVPGNPGIPGIHNPPREQDLGMMMDDEEKPRRVEEVVGLEKMG